MSFAVLSKQSYSKIENWQDFFKRGKHLKNIPFHLSWFILFENLLADKRFEKIHAELKKQIMEDKRLRFYPLPSQVFLAFLSTPADRVKVVFIGQDPYFQSESYNGVPVPQAMGHCFSVAHGIKIPNSLVNIFKNMVKFKHLKEIPESGNLWFWAAQGCLMLNSALTVEDDQKEAHINLWEWFTDYAIQYISNNMEGIVFVLWGSYAYNKNRLIDAGKHHIIFSTHPSGLSAYTASKRLPAFMSIDHFGQINKFLVQENKTPVIWN